jgi:hypothetical protein
MARNNTQVIPGGTVNLDVYFRLYTGGPLTDADSTPTYIIYDPNNNILASGSGTKISTGLYRATYTVSSIAVTSNTYSIYWTAIVGGVNVPDAWEYFQVVSAGSPSFSNILINQDDLNLIKKRLAYPLKDSILLTDEQIKDLIVRQALNEYFIKFPLKVTEDLSVISGTLTVNFPDTNTFGVVDVRVVGKGYAGVSGGSFWDLVYWNQMGLSTYYRSVYGSNMSGFNPNSIRQTKFMNQQVADSIVQQGTFKYTIDQENKRVAIYSSLAARANITWAKYSNNFDDIKFQNKWDVIKLSQAYLLMHVADTMELVEDSSAEIKIDAATLRDKANALKDEVFTKWLDYQSPLVMRQ